MLGQGAATDTTPSTMPCTAPVDNPVVALYEKAKASSLEIFVGGRSEGSGWLADPNGLLITAAHVISGKLGVIEVRGQAVPEKTVAKLVALDCGHDLALLRVPARERPYPSLEVAPKSGVIGQRAYLFGSAIFRRNIMLPGFVARMGTTYEFSAFSNDYVQAYHIAGASPPGTSGGFWLDEQGRVVANQSGYISLEKSPQGIAYVIPAEAIAKLLLERKTIVIAGLGMAVDELDEQSRDYIERFPPGQEGLVPLRFIKGGAAELAGLSRDTLIVAIDGKTFADRDGFLDAVRARRPGEEVTLRLLESASKPTREVKVRLRQVAPVVIKPTSQSTSKPAAVPVSKPATMPASRAAH